MSTSSCGVSGNLESLTDEAVILLGRVKWSRSDSGGEDDEELIEFIPLDSLGAENSTGMSLQLNYTRVTYCTETPVNRILIAPWPHLFTKISNSDHRNDLNHLFGTNEGCWAAIRCPRRPLVTRLQQCDGVCGRGLARQLLCLPPDADFLLFGDERHGRSICWLWRRKQRVGEIEWQAECNQQQGPATAIAPYLTVSEFRTGNKLNFGTTSKRKIFDICGRVQAISSLHRIQNQRFFFIRLVEIESVGGGEEAIIVICRSDLFCTLWFHYGLRVNAVVIVQRLKLMRLFPGRPNRERLLLCADPAYDSSFRVLSDPPAAVVLSQQRQSQRTFQPSQMSVGGSFIDGESHILLDENSISSAVENFASGTQESSSTNFTSSGTVCYQGRITRIIDASRSLVELDSGKVCCYLLHQPICVWRHLLSLTGSDD
jgi:hypothetical protein